MAKSIFFRGISFELIDFLNKEGYTTDCKINELSKENMGIATSVYFTRQGSYTIIPLDWFDNVNPHFTWNCAGRVDVNTDIGKAKQLAANL